MASYTECDRCGKTIEDTMKEWDKWKVVVVEDHFGDPDGHVDLCPECLKSLKTLLGKAAPHEPKIEIDEDGTPLPLKRAGTPPRSMEIHPKKMDPRHPDVINLSDEKMPKKERVLDKETNKEIPKTEEKKGKPLIPGTEA